jgi:hypothetical protein
MEIANEEEVTRYFGEWPSFHDAEVISIEIQRGETPGEYADLFASVHVRRYTPENVGTAQFEMEKTHDALISLRFRRIAELSLSGFNHQNVIDELVLLEEGARVQVTFESIFGVECEFSCAQVGVVAVVNRMLANA